MKKLLLLSCLIMTVTFVKAQNQYDELYSNAPLSNYNKSFESEKAVKTSLSDKDFHLYKSGSYSIKSAKCAYIAVVSSALAGISSVLASDVNNWSRYKINTSDTASDISRKNKDAKNLRNTLLVSAGVFGIIGITSTIISINYKMKSGKELHFSATSNGATASLCF